MPDRWTAPKPTGQSDALPGPVPSLDALAARPEQAAGLPAEARQAVTLRCCAILAALASVPTGFDGHAPEAPAEDRLLTVREAARCLGVSPDWLYRRAARLPFTVRLGRQVRFSAAGIERYIRQRQGRA